MKFKLTVEGTEEEIEEAKRYERWILGYNDPEARVYKPYRGLSDYSDYIAEVTYQVREKQYRVKTLKELVLEFGEDILITYENCVAQVSIKINGHTCLVKMLGKPYAKVNEDVEWYETFLKEE